MYTEYRTTIYVLPGPTLTQFYGFIRPASVKQEKDSFDEGLIIVYEHQIYIRYSIRIAIPIIKMI